MKFVIIGLILIILILIIRAIRFKPYKEKKAESFQIQLEDEDIVQRFAKMIKCKTVSYKDTSLEDENQFTQFKNLLREEYPRVNETCQLYYIGQTGILYHWRGKSSDKPVVFMAHYDVVPANSEAWEKDPFSASIEDGYIWGRGTLDTKGTLCGIMEAAERLMTDGFQPENDIYLSFSGDEETNGNSAVQIVDFLEAKGVKPFMVLDEGGAIVEGVLPGVKGKCALVGTGEKGKLHIRLSTKGQGGHASSPPAQSPIGILSKSVLNIERKPFSYRLSQPAKDMFNVLGRYSSLGFKILFANISLLKPLVDVVTRRTGGELNALVRTTTAFTKMSGSDALNVFPPYASIEGDIRIMEGDTKESIIEGYRKRIKDERVLVEVLDYIPVAKFSGIDTEAWMLLEEGIKSIWQDTKVSPYLMIACSDSRHYTKICDNVYRFSAMELSKEERKLIHGNNERIPIEKLITAVKFYICTMRKF